MSAACAVWRAPIGLAKMRAERARSHGCNRTMSDSGTGHLLSMLRDRRGLQTARTNRQTKVQMIHAMV